MQKTNSAKIFEKNSLSLSGIFKSVLYSLFFMMILILITSLFFLKTGISINYTEYAATMILYISFLFGGFISGKLSLNNGWKSGVVTGASLLIIITLAGIYDGIDLNIGDLFRVIVALFISMVSGVAGVNYNYTRKKNSLKKRKNKK